MRESETRTTDHRTRHWTGVVAVAFLLGGAGVVVRQPALLLAGAVGAVFAGYAGSARPPRIRVDGESVVELDRLLSESDPEPGDEVTVRVRVRNEGDAPLADLRLVDGVPPGLEVVDGSPRHATALRAGASTTFAYTVAATRGEHDWQPATVVAADASASVERETTVECATTLRCSLPLLATERLPVRTRTTPYAGRVETESGGAGLEFFATREYRATDPLDRIDWHRLARTGELGTVEFRRERTAAVVLLVDARRAAYRAPSGGERHAVERSVDAAGRLLSPLLDAGDRVGVTVFAPEEAWLAPGTGEEHRARARDLLTGHPSLSPVPPEEGAFDAFREDRREELRERRIRRLHGRLPDDAQVLVLSPCCDDHLPEVARRLRAYGHAVTVISPDPTATDSPGRQLARMERTDRLRALRADGVGVLDWDRETPLSTALARAQSRWSG
jgi:uncharacterized repeat protein (TIGR01451 family)